MSQTTNDTSDEPIVSQYFTLGNDQNEATLEYYIYR